MRCVKTPDDGTSALKRSVFVILKLQEAGANSATRGTESPFMRNTFVHPCVDLPCRSGVGGISAGSGKAQVISPWLPKTITALLVKLPKTHISESDDPSRGWVGMLISIWRRRVKKQRDQWRHKGEQKGGGIRRGERNWLKDELFFISQLYRLQPDKEMCVCVCVSCRQSVFPVFGYEWQIKPRCDKVIKIIMHVYGLYELLV